MAYQPRGVYQRRRREERIGSSPRFGQRGYWGYMGNSPVGMHPRSPPPSALTHDEDGNEDLGDLGLADLVSGTYDANDDETDEELEYTVQSRPSDRNLQSRVDFSGLVSNMLNTPVRDIKTPAPGGYPDSLFTNLSEEEKDKFECLICYHILKDPRECINKHKFCATCIYKWSVSQSDGRSSCPMCRTYGKYKPNFDIDRELLYKHVNCPENDCNWNGILREYKRHQKTHESHLDKQPVKTRESRDIRSDQPIRRIVGDSLGRNVSQSRNRSVDTALDGMHERSGRGMHTDPVVLQTTQRRIQRGRQRIQSMLDQVRSEMEAHEQRIQMFQEERERTRRQTIEEVNNIGAELGRVATGLMDMLDDMRLDSRRCNQYIHALRRGDGLPEISSSIARNRGRGIRRSRASNNYTSRSLPASSYDSVSQNRRGRPHNVNVRNSIGSGLDAGLGGRRVLPDIDAQVQLSGGLQLDDGTVRRRGGRVHRGRPNRQADL